MQLVIQGSQVQITAQEIFASSWLVKREHNWLLWGRSLQLRRRPLSEGERTREKASQKIRAKGGVARKKLKQQPARGELGGKRRL